MGPVQAGPRPAGGGAGGGRPGAGAIYIFRIYIYIYYKNDIIYICSVAELEEEDMEFGQYEYILLVNYIII